MTWQDFMDPEPLTVESLREKDLAYLDKHADARPDPAYVQAMVPYVLPIALRRAALGDPEPLQRWMAWVLSTPPGPLGPAERLCKIREAIIEEAIEGASRLPATHTVDQRGEDVCQAQEYHLLTHLKETSELVDDALLEALERWAVAAEEVRLETPAVMRIERWLELCPIPEEMQLVCIAAPIEWWALEMMRNPSNFDFSKPQKEQA